MRTNHLPGAEPAPRFTALLGSSRFHAYEERVVLRPDTDPQLAWQPPERPEWVRRVNAEAACMDLSAVVPLDEKSLKSAARRSAGLADFGDPEWEGPFRAYLQSVEEEAQLNLIGRLRIRQEILIYLEARLRVEETYKRHPEIGSEEIRKPIIVTGQGRCGTSLLQNVLAAHPDYGPLRHWEMLFPCPPPEKVTYATDPRIGRADAWIAQWNRVVPSLRSMRELSGEMPFDCTVLMSMAFSSDGWLSAFAHVPSFHAFLARLDPLVPLRFHRRMLKLLQWRNPRAHWVLKDVLHLTKLDALLAIYPDACIVWAHRDPVRATASFNHMLGAMQWAGSDMPLRRGSLDILRDPARNAGMLERAMELLDRGAIPEARVFHVHYRDLVRDTMGTVEALHRHFGIPLSDAGRQDMRRYLEEHPRDARPPHRYPAAQGEALTRARAAYGRYQARFDVPTE